MFRLIFAILLVRCICADDAFCLIGEHEIGANVRRCDAGETHVTLDLERVSGCSGASYET